MNKKRLSKKKKQVYRTSVFFEQDINFRIKYNDLRDALNVIRKNKGKYSSLSHYIRCAVIKLNRDERKRLF